MVEVVGLGEVLWDLFPSGKVLGGAPCNFAFHCHQLGHPTAVASRVGRDDLGRELRAELRRLGLADDLVQDDSDHPTGTVSVALDEGQPTYTIHEDVAYDHLAWDDALAAACGSTLALCFGTLAQRHPTARAAIQKAVQVARAALVVYDVNLRQHFWSPEVVEASLRACRWVKLNDDELRVLGEALGLAGDSESERLRDLRGRFAIELGALTRGAKGALVQTDDEEVTVPGVAVEVVDTVGAGDAFTAGLVCAVLEGGSVGDATVFANRLAARVASAAGGTPAIGRAEIEGFYP